MPLNHKLKGEILFKLGASYNIEKIIFKGLHVQIYKEYWLLCSFENSKHPLSQNLENASFE
jgi:hypothetical protein